MMKLGIMIAVMAGLGWKAGLAQSQSQQVQTTNGLASSSPTTVKPAAKKKPKPSAAAPAQRIPIETASPATPTAVEAAQQAQQRAADQKLLQQEQEQSDKAAQINNAIVEKAQKQQEQMQKEVRIQDAPGPAQTGAGVTPQVGMPTVPTGLNSQGIPPQPAPAQSISPSDLPSLATPATNPSSTSTVPPPR
jgi:hypothetical protein